MFDLAAQALRQRFDHRDSLAVTTQRKGMEIPGVGVARHLFLRILATLSDLEQQLALARVIGLDVYKRQVVARYSPKKPNCAIAVTLPLGSQTT